MIDGPEFLKAMRELGLTAPVQAVTAVFDSFDPDGSGTIDYKELDQILHRSFLSHPDLPPLDLTASNKIAARTISRQG